VIPQSQPGGSGFTFDRLGVRIPALLISPFTKPGTILNDVFDHTSVLKTVMTCCGLGTDGLGRRTAAAKDLSGALNLEIPRSDTPNIPQPPNMEISLMQRTAAAGRWLMHASEKPVAKSVFDAEAVAIKLEAELWKKRHAISSLV